MISSNASTEQGSNGFVLRADTRAMQDTAEVLGRVGKPALASAAEHINFGDVFNCLCSLRHASNRYIASEGGESAVRVTSWNSARLAGFLDLIVQDKVEGLSSNQHEKESLRILRDTLRGTNDHIHH